MKPRKEMTIDRSPLRLLLWTALAGLIFGLIGFGEVPEDLLRASRNRMHTHQASGDIVLVSVDDKSLRALGRWPWPRSTHAKLVQDLTDAGAKRIFFDIMFETRSDPREDRAFAKAIRESGRVTLPVRARTGMISGATTTPDSMPLPILKDHSDIGTISVAYNYHNSVWYLPYAEQIGDKVVPSFAAKLARVSGPVGTKFPIDYSLDPRTIPSVSAVAVLNGSAGARQFAGKDVVIGVTSDSTNDQYFIPSWGQMGGVYVHLTAAEMLKRGTPVALGWVPGLLIALALAAFAAYRKSALQQNIIFASAIALVLLLPAVLEMERIFADITPALFVLLTVTSVMHLRRLRARGLVNAVSGMPNLAALRFNGQGRDQALIGARVLNYADIVATLPADGERQLVEQVVARLKLGAPERMLYHGDGGIFAWFEDARFPVGNHLDALSAVFRNPAKVRGMPLDLAVSFGVEIGSGRSLANRLASALVAADDAALHGLKWKYHDPESLQDAGWRLSIMSQLDSAIDKGEVWVAFQPKLDLRTRQIVGAEALARWTHPEKGPIAATEFVSAAEQHDRIGKLTDFVLEKSVAAGAEMHRRQPGFRIAVNLSARLLADAGLPLRIRAMLARHGLPPENLTLELTETAELMESGPAITLLNGLRDLGITISIDDYGTGLSTLEYLKKVPASEIKIDQSFVKGMVENRSDLVMVQSTITLAHSLDRRVVAEGVEHRETLQALEEMGCDEAQGFIIGRPMSIESLIKRIATTRRSQVA